LSDALQGAAAECQIRHVGGGWGAEKIPFTARWNGIAFALFAHNFTSAFRPRVFIVMSLAKLNICSILRSFVLICSVRIQFKVNEFLLICFRADFVSPYTLQQTPQKESKAFVLLLLVLALVNMILTFTILSVLRLGHGMQVKLKKFKTRVKKPNFLII
jgi:hypothetical protein